MAKERKNEMLSIRVSPSTLENARRKAKQHALSMADFVAELINNSPEYPKARRDQRDQG